MAVILAAGAGGCQAPGYYAQAIRGQVRILRQRQPIDCLLADPHASPELKARFELVSRLRGFAASELKLPIGKQYLTYVDLGRPFAVWNVHAAPEFSLAPKKWFYPLVGSLKYRGYFAEADARDYARGLKREGWDVCVEGVEAYSTLGWFSDPLLNTFIHHSEAELAEILFHELAHQRLFLGGDTDFNEAFATVVGEEGTRRWFAAKGDAAGATAYRAGLERNRQFVALILQTRRRLESVYVDGKGACPGRGGLDVPATDWRRADKAQAIAELREGYARLKSSWDGYSGYDGWFAGPLNNAQLNTVALYYDLVPGFEALLAAHGGDMEAFYQGVHAMRRLGRDERHRRLMAGASIAMPGPR